MHSLFDIFELLDILDFDIVWVVGEQVDGAWNHVLGQQAQQFVCQQTQQTNMVDLSESSSAYVLHGVNDVITTSHFLLS